MAETLIQAEKSIVLRKKSSKKFQTCLSFKRVELHKPKDNTRNEFKSTYSLEKLEMNYNSPANVRSLSQILPKYKLAIEMEKEDYDLRAKLIQEQRRISKNKAMNSISNINRLKSFKSSNNNEILSTKSDDGKVNANFDTDNLNCECDGEIQLKPKNSNNSNNDRKLIKVNNNLINNYDIDEITENEIENFIDSNIEKHIESPSDQNQIQCINNNETHIPIEDIKDNVIINKKCYNLYKSGDAIRKLYYSKLIHKKLWNPSRTKKKHHSLIIFDWDDTLLPTTFLTPNGEYNDKLVLSQSEADQFKLIEKAVYKILTTALEKGETYIITNAAPGWVEYTGNKFYPSIIRVLQNIKVLSARGAYEKSYPKDYRQWKIQTFLEMKKEFDSNLITNIMCMGDSMIEMEAGHLLSSKFNKAYIKTIKFRESPRLKVLYKQLLMIIEKFNEIYLTLKSLAISIDKKPVSR